MGKGITATIRFLAFCIVAAGLLFQGATAVAQDAKLDVDAYARENVRILNEIVTVLEGVRDRPSAARALDSYEKLAFRNEALFRATGPSTQAQRDAATRKYGAALDAALKRQNAQLERLAQAPYGGLAFLNEIQRIQKAAKRRD